MKKIALALITLVNLGNGSDDEFFVKKNENLNKSFIRSIGTNRTYIGDRNFTIDENEFKKALMAENNKTKESYIEIVGNFDFECPTLGKSIIGERVRNTTYIYHVKKEDCFKTQKVLNKEVKKSALKCLLENHSKNCNITVDDIELVKEYTSIQGIKIVE